ncbi:dTDP-3-amino-3,6-dideoxy-alpha-D-glucopyranose N,N-dimethyltransferase [Thalassocella blandensis]|nr:dTDP-3-amino-3,6-dideoxy-alpha-D-glucopyranose N,N-dimethyltransferase [Thalassocella blandensis]
MHPTDIGRAYDQITHLWTGDTFNRHNGIDAHRRALKFVQESTELRRALDVGCGCTGRFIELLLEHGFKPDGVDVSNEMLSLAKQRHPQLSFYHQDICEWNIPKQYDFISAWDSIWHVPLAQQVKVMRKLVASLNPNGVLIFSCGGIQDSGEHVDSAMGPQMYYASLGVQGFTRLIESLGCLCRHFEYDQYPELHAYYILQKLP